ncbi:MAG: hypothetical protein PHS34_09430 [Candidatus Omnitrophica bacterium]|nr:hypothetical protein [Candidatus Omnitrophota bacterium]
MKKIDIQINQAKILGYEVKLNEDKPEVAAEIGLFSGEKKITTFRLTTENYYSNSVMFELPYELIEPIKQIAQELETILTRECNKSLGRLPMPK